MKTMKTVALGLGIMGLVTVGLAVAAVKDTPHNLSSSGLFTYKTNATNQVCVFCHTPHGANEAITGFALWNRRTDNAGFQMYQGGSMTIAGAPQGPSLACLSCHDGTIAFDSMFNGPTSAQGVYNYDPTGASRGWAFTGGNVLPNTAGSYMGRDLRNDHPISVTYDPSRTSTPGEWNTLAAARAAGARFFGAGNNVVECGSCHNPHSNTQIPFLRASMDNSGLCTQCHLN